jgi:DNA repair protein RadC
VHNHPSGDPSPSDDDIDVTREIKAAANMLQIALHDHVIVGNGRCFSLRSNGLM